MDVPCSYVGVNDDDALFEILLRVNPRDIFNCILVCKDWLRVITNPTFWTDYLKIWKNSSCIVLGLLRIPFETFLFECKPLSTITMLATNHMGRNIIARTLTFKGVDEFFISKSSQGGILLLGSVPAGFKPKTWLRSTKTFLKNTFFPKKEKFLVRLYHLYVCNPFSQSGPIKLPPPPVKYERFTASILSCDGGEFKVILARSWYTDNKVGVQIYCSRTRRWEEQFTPSCSTDFFLSRFAAVQPGIVSIGGGRIYWMASRGDFSGSVIAAWDTDEGHLSLIPLPSLFGMYVVYGVSAPATLLAATGNTSQFYQEPDFRIWAFDDGEKEWSLLYHVSKKLLWNNNVQLLTSVFKVMPKPGFQFVSFFPGKSDCFFVGMGKHLFIYRFHSAKLEHVDYDKYGDHHWVPSLSGVHNKYHPLTMLDFKGPSSPSCLHFPHSSSSSA